jgi:hypothetical protein
MRVNSINSFRETETSDMDDIQEQDVSVDESDNSTELSDDQTDTKNSVSYSIVEIDEVPASYASMKDILNQCIASFNGIGEYIVGLASKNINLSKDIKSVSSEIDEISINDGTGAGTKSTYSLTLPGENTETTDTSSDENSSDNERNNANNDEINSKMLEVTSLSKEANENSLTLQQATLDIKTTGLAVDKVLAKVGVETEKKNNILDTALAGVAVSNLALTTAKLVSPAAGVLVATGGVLSMVNNKKDSKEKDEVKNLGAEAKTVENSVLTSIKEVGGNIDETVDKVESVGSNLQEKSDKITENQNSQTEVENKKTK